MSKLQTKLDAMPSHGVQVDSDHTSDNKKVESSKRRLEELEEENNQLKITLGRREAELRAKGKLRELKQAAELEDAHCDGLEGTNS